MKRNNAKKLSALICLALALVLAMTAMFAITASAATTSETISFADTAQRKSLTAEKQVWNSGNVTFTNDKATSSNDVADYSNPVRIYANSTITIECNGTMKEIVIVSNGTAKYKTALENSLEGAGYTYSNSGNNYTITVDANTVTFSATAQLRFNSISVTYESANCEHVNKTTSTTDPNCTESGSVTVTCNDCGTVVSNDPIPATGHINTTTTTVDPTCTTTGSVTVTCDDCGETVSTEEIQKTPHNYENGVCKDCGTEETVGYELVTDVSMLNVGDSIIIVAAEYDKALGATQDNNNRPAVSIVKDGNTVSFGNDVEVLTLVAGNKEGTFAFKASEGYLYAASSSSNHLKSQATLSDNSSWKIEITDGVATIKAQGTNTRNWLRYNPNNGSPIFSCYGSGQQDINIYKLPTKECTHEAKLESANVNLGKSLAVKYYVSLCDHVDAASYTMQFTMNGVTTAPVACEAEKYNGYTVFVFGGIAPQCMGDEFTAQLLCDGEEVAGATHTYSILANFENLLADTANDNNAALKQVIYDALAYGAAAQQYVGYKTDALVNDGYENDATTDATKPANSFTLSELAEGAEFSIKSAGVEFGDVNRIYVKIKNVTDVTAVEVKVGETVLEAVATSEEGVYAYYSDGISALNLDTAVEFVLCDAEGNTLQTLNYSVNTYVNRKWDDDNMMNLVRALYNYGKSAKAYAGN